MDSVRWSQIEEIFHEVLEHPEDQRPGFLHSICDGDSELETAVTSLLGEDSRSSSLLDRGLSEIAYQTVGDSMDFISSREFGPYRLEKILGEGGMGVVWLAERTDAGNLVAIKFLPHAGLSPVRRQRFAREIKTLAKLKYPYIARLYDAGTLADGTPWFVMEYVEGTRFAEYCRESGRSIEELLHLFRSVCEAVQYAHGQEVIHRDLKPSNIMIAEDGTPRLLDFGIARELHQLDETPEQTRSGLRFWSPHYAAPEWICDGIVGLFTDVYSLGVILYEMLTGQLPADRSQSSKSNNEKREHDIYPTRPSYAVSRMADTESKNSPASKLSKSAWRDLDVLCLKAMHQDALQRYPSVEALMRDLDHFLKSEPLEVRPDTVRYRACKFVRRHRDAVLAASVTVVLVFSMVLLFTLRLANARNTALAEASRREQIQRFMLNLFQGGDKEAGPAEELRVVTLIDRGVQGAQALSREPEVQADLYQTLGTMYQKLGKLDRANDLLQTSLHIRNGLPEPDRSAIADNLIALGLLQAEQEKSKEAEQSVREALVSVQTHDPHNRPLLGEAESALGSVLVANGHQAQSVDVLKQAISTIESEGTAPSPELSQAIGTLADAQLFLGHYDEAVALNQRALAIDRQIYGDMHPHIADDLGNLAQLKEVRGYYADAERYERPALQIMEAWYGADHPETARKMTTLASTLILEGKYSEAENLLQRALDILENALGNQHESVAYAANSLASVELHEKKFDEAESNDQKVVAIYRFVYGDGDYRVAVGLGNLASVYCAEKRYQVCERMLDDVLERFTNVLGAGNINTGIAQVRLGRTLLHEEKYKEAERHSLSGYETLSKQTSSQTSYVQGALHDLIEDYTALNRSRDAQLFKEKLEASNLAK
jgi:serine/threonine protein kinase